MSQEHVELARQAYDAYNREGINGVLRYLDPEIECRNPAESPNAGVFVGHEGVVEWQRMVDDAFREMHLSLSASTSFPTDESSQWFVSGFAHRPPEAMWRSP